MNLIFLLGFPALLLFSTAQGLFCRFCDSGNGKRCYDKEDICKTYAGYCYTYASYRDGELYYTKFSCIYSRLGDWLCNKTEKAGPYVRITSCCSTDKCNGEVPLVPQDWN